MPELYKHLRAETWGSAVDRYVLEHPVIEIDDILVDAEAFFETRSTCEMCGVNCAWGTTIPKETADKLLPILDDIKGRYIPPERRHTVGWHFSDSYGMNYSNVDRKIGCCFLYDKDGHPLCSIYSWAIENSVDPFEYWPFECIMFPIALQPYEGILHPGKTLLTLWLPWNWQLVDVYGDRPANRTVYGIWRKEIKKRIRRKLRLLLPFRKKRVPKPVWLGAHFSQREGFVKPLSYKYYGPHLKWYFGEDFYHKLCEQAEVYLRNKFIA